MFFSSIIRPRRKEYCNSAGRSGRKEKHYERKHSKICNRQCTRNCISLYCNYGDSDSDSAWILGNTCILLVAVLFGQTTGLLAGGIGSALADLLTGYTQWVIPTLIIKSIMGFVIGAIAHRKGTGFHMVNIRTFLGSVAGIVIMIFGYFAAGAIMNGSIYTGWTQVPGLTLEGMIGMVVFYAIGLVLEKAHVVKILNLES